MQRDFKVMLQNHSNGFLAEGMSPIEKLHSTQNRSTINPLDNPNLCQFSEWLLPPS